LTRIATIGPFSIDVVGEQPPRPGGTVFYAGRALGNLGADAHVAASCALADRDELLPRLEAFGLPVRWYESANTTAFRFRYTRTGRRIMRLEAAGDPWSPENAVEAIADARWVYVGGLLRTDFPRKTLAALAETGAKLLVDAQGLVRTPRLGPLRSSGDIGDVLRYAAILKLDVEEAEALVTPGETLPSRLQRLGPPEIVLTMGRRGAAVITQARIDAVPARDVTGPVDPTGAGDTFSAAYLVARSDGAEPLDALRSATDTVAEFLAGE
jgi:sugar/nucleoside kinase (ribokinase family)